MKKKTRHQKRLNQHRSQERFTKERPLGKIKTFQPPAAGTAADGAAAASKFPLAQPARSPNAMVVIAVEPFEQATPPATEAAPSHAHGPADDKHASALTNGSAGGNGELFAINDLQSLAPDEREIVRQSDNAFLGVRQSWQRWKEVRAGLVVLRNLAMRETGANSPMSKRYKDRFHDLLEQRAYCSAKMDPSVRKALLKCAESVPEIDEWHDRLDEHRRLRLNNPITVLHAFRKSQEPPSSAKQSPQIEHERELAKVREEAAAAIANRDERINELRQRVDNQSTPIIRPSAAATDIDSIAKYVIATCDGDAIKIGKVIDALKAHLERGA